MRLNLWPFSKFQSTPPVSRRRCGVFWVEQIVFSGFNPRLLFPEGDASHFSSPGWLGIVSIHASCFQKAMRGCCAGWPTRCRFQSTPPVSRRRCQIRYRQQREIRPVSIHASCFQKAMRGSQARSELGRVVSIHASCFQKAMPALDAYSDCCRGVSIHASCFQKAMRVILGKPSHQDVFQSTPPVSRRRCILGHLLLLLTLLFQSTPPVSRRRCGQLRNRESRVAVFNPRLLFPEGDARWAAANRLD